MDRSARARSFRLKSEWTQNAPGPRGPSSFLFAHPPSPLSRNGQEATKPTGSSSVRALRTRTLFQVSPDGPVACPRQFFRLRAACLVFIFYLLWPYVDAIFGVVVFGFLLFLSFSSLQGCSQTRALPLRSVPVINFNHSCELFQVALPHCTRLLFHPHR